MSRPRYSDLLPYLGAIAIVAAATMVRFATDPILQNRQPFAVFIIAVILAARYCGFAPSLLALALSASSSLFFFIQPRGSFRIQGTVELGSFGFFVLIGLFVVFVMRSEQRARHEARQKARIALEKQQELEREVVERKHSEALAREAEERFRLLADHAPIGIAQADAQGSIFFVNGKWCELAGVTPQEAMGFSWQKYIHPDDREAFLQHWQSHLQAARDMPLHQCRIVHADGDIRWVSSTISMLTDASGAVTGQIVATRDISQQKSVEMRFRGIYEQAPLGIALIDSHTGRFLQINPRYEQIIRRTEAEMAALTFQEITPPDDLVEDLDRMELLRQGTIRRFHLEKKLIRGDNSLMWASLTVVPMWQPGESPSCHLAIVEDITERKAVADALCESEERFRAFMDNSPAFAWAKDEQGRYIYVSKSFEERLQVRLEEARGKTDFDLWPKDVAQALWESDQRVLAGARPIQITDVMMSGSERRYWFKNKFLFQDSRNRRFVGGVGVDITELKSTEESLRTKQDLLRYLIEVQEQERQFLCHEFHDGLIQYAAGSLMSLEGYRSTRPSTEDLSQVDAAIVNLRKGVEDGRRVIRGIRPAVLDDSGLEAAIDDLIGQFKSSGIMVTQKCDPQIGRLPDSIQTTVYRVVQEALNNARKHSGTDVVRIELNKRNGDLHLEVLDFGCGFDLKTTSRRGFGLPGMAERCRILGGDCQIQSEQDVGTRISVRLPIPSAS